MGKVLKTFSVPSQVQLPAMGYSMENFAALDSESKRMLLGKADSSTWVVRGDHLSRPSFDHFSWVWTADDSGLVYAVSAEKSSEAVSLSVDWLATVEVTSFNVSRDGTRALISGTSNGVSQLWIAGIVRDPQSFKPKALTTPVHIDTGKNLIADWNSDSRVVVGDTSTGRIDFVSLSGERENLRKVQNLVSLNSGLGENEILAGDAEGTVYQWKDSTWKKVDVAYSGLNYSG